MDKIYQKLNNARKMVREGGYKKDGRNEYSKYDYFTPEMVENIVSDVCEKNKLLTLCNLRADEYGLYQELVLVDLDGENNLVFQLRTTQGEMKATNATQQMGGTDTYSERYIKMKVFQIKDNNLDFDSQDNTKINKTTTVKPKPTPDEAFTNAQKALKDTDTLEALNEVNTQIIKSKILTDKHKQELSYLYTELAEKYDPTK